MPDVFLQAAGSAAERALQDQGLTHLHVRTWGKYLIIYSGDPAEAENRARLTQLRRDHYRLDMAGRGGRWETTPYIGTMSDLLATLTGDFGFVLVPW